ncbi:hypothetical protein KSP40_PGU021755 [Platanthera guangdongensis]|uniref:Uncharacterized protein n=1 Tax=Platanthera guangdongensis TaxID=2320717 RepID=A0ABR2M2P8_9ASPA
MAPQRCEEADPLQFRDSTTESRAMRSDFSPRSEGLSRRGGPPLSTMDIGGCRTEAIGSWRRKKTTGASIG